MAITTILSDLGNVVVLFDSRQTDRTLAGITGLSERAVSDVIRRRCSALLRRFGRGAVSKTQFHRTCCSRMDAKVVPTEDEFFRAWTEGVFARNNPVIERWRLLRRAGLTMTAVSNIDVVRHEALLNMRGVLEVFGESLVSYQEGIRKPSAEFLIRALDRSGANAADTLFVDDLEENLVPARKLGINVHCYRTLAGLDECLVAHGLASLPT